MYKKQMNFKPLIILLILITPLSTFAEQNIRVRILEKYHPKKILISYRESIYEEIDVDLSTMSPKHFNTETLYTIKIPSIGFERLYFGTLTFYKGDELIVVNSVPLERYVVSVVLSELGLKKPEAMCAQSVISRTWALSHLRPKKRWDFNDLTISQVYKGVSAYDKKTESIISQTLGQTLYYNRKPAEIYFHAKCSDRIYSSLEIWGTEISYLNSKGSKIDKAYTWKARVDINKLNNIFSQRKVNYTRLKRDGMWFIKAGSTFYSIDNFRLKVNRVLGWHTLKSTDFNIIMDGDTVNFTGKGHGHLVGFCQESAVKMAKNGYSYDQILSYFFPGCTIENYLM
jgi:stage II sporulation protein D